MMNVQILEQASDLWNQGVEAKAIAAALGMTTRQIYSISEYHRDRFPRRQVLEVADEQVNKASGMWLGGLTIPEIRDALGLSEHQVYRMRKTHPELFPHRIRLSEGYLFPEKEQPKPKVVHEDRVRWITEQGAAVTLPRVSFISCPRSA